MELFYQWIRDVLSVLQKNEDTDPKRIAIDGKAVRAAAANGRGIPYIISAYLGNYGLSIGQLKVGEKTNEIKEIPKLLKKLDISNCVITIDAIGCQKPIAKQIVEQKGHYCLAVKTNQPLLYEEVKEYFSYAEKIITHMSRMEMVLFRVQMLVKVIGLKLRLLIKEIVLPTVIATKQRFGIMAEWLEFQPLFFVECI